MAIKVICPGCRATFTVSDKFAGRTGPCPKCKKPITVPSDAVKEVTIHAPEEEAVRSGRGPTAPIVFVEQPTSRAALIAVGVGAVAAMLLAFLSRSAWGGPGQAPLWLLAATACIVAHQVQQGLHSRPYRPARHVQDVPHQARLDGAKELAQESERARRVVPGGLGGGLMEWRGLWAVPRIPIG